MDFLKEELKRLDFVIHCDLGDYNFFEAGNNGIRLFVDWEGVYVAFQKDFGSWSSSKLNQQPIAIPYTPEQMNAFWTEIANYLNKNEVLNCDGN